MMLRVFLLVCVMPWGALAQSDSLSLAQVLQTALNRHPSIQMAWNRVEIAKNNTFPGMSGLLPSISASGSVSYNNANQNSKFLTGQEQNVRDAESSSLNTSIGLNYTLFDGLGIIYTFRKSKVDLSGAEMEAKVEAERILAQTAQAYYRVAELQESLRVASEGLKLSALRVEEAKARVETGKGIGMDVLNAEVDMNADSANWANARLQLENGKRQLALLMGVVGQHNFAVIPGAQLEKDFYLDDVLSKAQAHNPNLVRQGVQIQSSEYAVKQQKANLWPTLTTAANYSYGRQTNDAGILQYNQSYGFTANLRVQANIFNGLQTQKNIENAKIRLMNDRLNYDLVRLQLQSDVEAAVLSWNQQKYLLELELRNNQQAQRNFELTRERYSLGQLTPTQVREAQQNLLNSDMRIVRARYQAKLQEIEIKRLCGELLSPGNGAK